MIIKGRFKLHARSLKETKEDKVDDRRRIFNQISAFAFKINAKLELSPLGYNNVLLETLVIYMEWAAVPI
jgi:hypothetical protein